jgi:hypothetical protein
MKRMLKTAILVGIGVVIGARYSVAADWMLRVEDSGRVCHVQLKTASRIGDDFKGPFSSRKAACQEAATQYDDSDRSKCWTYGGGTVTGCRNEGVTLPPKKSGKKRRPRVA